MQRLDGTVKLPGSKSLSNRILLLAALADGTTDIENLLVRTSLDAVQPVARGSVVLGFMGHTKTRVSLNRGPAEVAVQLCWASWSHAANVRRGQTNNLLLGNRTARTSGTWSARS